MTRPALSQADVARLLVDQSTQARIEVMSKVVAAFDSGSLDARAQATVREIIARFASDAEVAVREAVAWQICNSPLLTEALAQRLIQDVSRVAFPLLRHERNLDDSFLLRVIAERDPVKQVAIAGRARVSPPVADALVDTANLRVITCLLANEGAEIVEPTLHKTLDRYGDLEAVHGVMASRADLPLTVVEKLIHYVSEEIREALVVRHRLDPDVVRELVAHGREAATVLLLSPIADGVQDLELFTRHLHMRGRLTPSLLFRALCSGEVALFVAGIAARCRIPVDNARTLVFDDGPLGLRAAFDKARLPGALLPPFRAALTVVKEMNYDGTPADRRAFQVAVVGRVFNECGHIEDRQVDDLLLQLFEQKPDDVIEQAMEEAGIPFLPVRSP